MVIHKSNWIEELKNHLKETGKWDKLVMTTDMQELYASGLVEILGYILETPASQLPIDY